MTNHSRTIKILVSILALPISLITCSLTAFLIAKTVFPKHHYQIPETTTFLENNPMLVFCLSLVLTLLFVTMTLRFFKTYSVLKALISLVLFIVINFSVVLASGLLVL